MKTIEAAYIMPIVFIITAISITICFKFHDKAVSYAAAYGILTEHAASLENEAYNPQAGYTKKEISTIISDLFLIVENPSLSVCLSGNSLYISNNNENNSTPVFFSNYERCDTLRKESLFIINLLKDNK